MQFSFVISAHHLCVGCTASLRKPVSPHAVCVLQMFKSAHLKYIKVTAQ